MILQSKKIAILIEKQYHDIELFYPYYRFKEEGAIVDLIGPNTNEEFIGKFGVPQKAHKDAALTDPTQYDAVIIPGGFAPDFMRRTPAMIDFVKKAHDAGKIITAICHGGWMLASAGILRDKKVTTFFAIKDDLINAGAHYEDGEVVKDGQIITSRKPDDLPAFCREIIAALAEK